MKNYYVLFAVIFFLLILSSCSNLFNKPPVKPYSPEPADGAVNQSKNLTLSWECFDPDKDKLTFEIRFGIDTLESTLTNCTEFEYPLKNLDGNTTYKWRIIASDEKGKITKSDIWTFTTKNEPPSKPFNPSPQDKANIISEDITLRWDCIDPDNDSLVYDIYFGTSGNSSLIASDYPKPFINPGKLQKNRTYYWKVKAKDNSGRIVTGSIWSFTTKHSNQPPTLIKVSGPSKTTIRSSNTFTWSSIDPNGEIVDYEYRKDNGNWHSNGLSTSCIWNDYFEGKHIFEVRAKNIEGNYLDLLSWNFIYNPITLDDFWRKYDEVRKYENLANIKAKLPSTVTSAEDLIEIININTHRVTVKNKIETSLVLEVYMAGLLLKEVTLQSLQTKELTVPWDGTEYEILIKENDQYISDLLSFTTITSETSKEKGLFFEGPKINEKEYGAYPQYVDYIKSLDDFTIYSMMLHGVDVKVLYSPSSLPFDSKEKEEQFLYILMTSFHRIWYYFGGYPYTSYEFIFLPESDEFPEKMNDELPAGVLFTTDILEGNVLRPNMSGSICEAWFPCTFFKNYESETVWIHKSIYTSCHYCVGVNFVYWHNDHLPGECELETDNIALVDAWDIYLDTEKLCVLLICYHKPQPIIRTFTVEYMKNSGNDAIDFYRELYTELLLNNKDFDSNDINTLPLNTTAEEFKEIIIKLTQNEELVNNIYETYVNSGSAYENLDIDLYKSKNFPHFIPKWEGEEDLLRYYDEVLYERAKDVPGFNLEYTPTTGTLQLEVKGKGKVFINGSGVSEGKYEYKKGEYLEGYAEPAEGWRFSHWLVNDSKTIYDNPFGQRISGNIKAQAVFVKKISKVNLDEKTEVTSRSFIPQDYDTDGDFLPNFLEDEIGTDPENIDSDNDGLTDYDEYTKYLTDPLNDDSDNDGIIDSDWNERREFSYNLRVVINITYPYYLNTDHYHFMDIRKLPSNSKPDELDNTDAEVIIYPNSYEILQPKPIKERDYSSFDGSIKPNIWINFNEQMGNDVLEKYGPFETDWEALEVISSSKGDFDILTSFKGYNTAPVYIDVYYKNRETRFLERGGYSEIEDSNLKSDFVEFCLNYNILGKQMFYNKTRRHCGSTANLLTTMYRSVGLPCKITQTTILGEKNQETINMINNEVTNNIIKSSLINSLSPVSCVMNHFIATPLIDRRWIESESKFEKHSKYCIVKPSHNLYNVRLQLFSHPEEAEYYIWAQKQDEGNFHLVEMIEIEEHLPNTPIKDEVKNNNKNSINSDEKHTQQMLSLHLEIIGKGKVFINGSGVSEGKYEYKKGEYLEGYAVPAEGWRFSHWLVDGSTIVYDNPIGQTFNDDVKAKAVFVKDQ